MSEENTRDPRDFIRTIIDADLAANKNEGRVHTRFPPEPNGYLHIGHAKSICLNFGLAQEYKGQCNLRFDDTNPIKEDDEYIRSIQEDIHWLGFDWEDRLFYASDYYETLYEFALRLINKGLAYVDDLSTEEIRNYRGTLKAPGKESPWRNRSVAENLDLFARMRQGEFPDGSKTLRAKIDMGAPNINMRDPVLYRILRARHHRTGDTWCIYPMYDFAHGQSDAIEGITHSLCTLEFEDHRPLYNCLVRELELPHKPRQIEFARLNLTYTVMSKRMLLSLVQNKHVSGWDDPRMPTISGLRRRGYTAASIRSFADRIGLAKRDSTVDIAFLEHVLREELNRTARRMMAVLRPLKVTITNYPEDQVEYFDFINNPENPDSGTRPVPFSRTLYIEQTDFMEDPPKKFFRLAPGREVRLRYAYFITCDEMIKDPDGNVTELLCHYDPASRGGNSPDGRKVRGTLHWVSVKHAIPAEVRLYEHLFNKENPHQTEEGQDFTSNLNSQSLEIVQAQLEPALAEMKVDDPIQFERTGYFCVDRVDSTPEAPVFNRTVSLKDSWARMQK